MLFTAGILAGMLNSKYFKSKNNGEVVADNA
jgi:BASS family bile acid:Na+ symporter